MAAEQGGPSKLESPERSHPISAKETQDSPLFTYLCSLSPIKPVRSVHVAQTFSELSFPPPPAVFVSPRVDQKATTCLKRAVSRARGVFMRPVAGHGKENLCSRKQNSVGGPSLSKGEAIPPKEVKEESSNSSPSNSPTKLGNNFVEQYLADPIETGLPRPSSDLVHFETFLEKSISENVEEHESLTPLPSEVTDDRVDSDSRSTKPAECQISVNVDAQEVSKGTIEIAGRKMVEVFVIPKDANAEELTPKENGSVEQLLDIDQNSSDLAFLLSGTTDKLSGQIDWPKQQPHQPVSGFLASTTEFFTENIEGTETDLNLQEMSGDYKSELVIEVKEEDEMEVSKDDQVAVSFRDGMVVVVFHEVAQRAKVRERGERNGDRKIDLPEQVSNANANHRGVLRRCLNFESTEAHRKSLSITATTSQGSLSDSEAHSLSPISTSNLTISESQLSLVKAEQKTPPSDIIACSKAPMPSMMSASRRSSIVSQNTVESLARCDSHLVSSARNSSASLLSMGMPSGIGLHLNSLAGALSHSTRENSSTCTSHSSAINMKERTPESASGNSGGTLQAGSSVVVSLVEKTRMDHLESSAGSAQTGVTKSTTRFRSLTLGIKQLDGNTRFCGVEKRLSPLGRKRVLLQDFCRQSDLDMSDDSGQSPQSSKNKRKLSLGGEKNTDGCKRCNCKKSKCLKLYCECFAAGVYCVDSCSCHNCFNKPEFEDTVLETRKQIESRNPLAFAPKIVKGADSVAIIGDEVGDTSASARHKRGCNCKKSMCLKKYCECYQAGVGCSDFCRCEGCKNLYGRKGSEELDDKVSQEGLSEKQFAEDEPSRPDLKAVVATSDQHQNKDLSPITPFQETGRPPVKLRPIGKKRFFSSDALQPSTACCESVVKQARSPSRLLRSSKEEEADLFQISSSKGASSPALTPTPKLSRIGKFSPQWDGLADICTLTPLPHAPNRPTPASASIHDQVDSSSSPSSFRTPLESKELFASMRSTPCGVQSKLDSDSCRLVGLIEDDEDGDDDDTPEFLKESDDALKQSPMSILKPSSSKQKRVSPPHHHPTLLNNTGTRETTTSPAAGKSRKFILHAVSSFP